MSFKTHIIQDARSEVILLRLTPAQKSVVRRNAGLIGCSDPEMLRRMVEYWDKHCPLQAAETRERATA